MLQINIIFARSVGLLKANRMEYAQASFGDIPNWVVFIATADCNWQPGSRSVEQSCRNIRLCSWWMHSLEGELGIVECFRGWSHRHSVSAKEQAIIGVWYWVITYSKTCYLTSRIWGVTILMTLLAPPSQYTLGLFTMYEACSTIRKHHLTISEEIIGSQLEEFAESGVVVITQYGSNSLLLHHHCMKHTKTSTRSQSKMLLLHRFHINQWFQQSAIAA